MRTSVQGPCWPCRFLSIATCQIAAWKWCGLRCSSRPSNLGGLVVCERNNNSNKKTNFRGAQLHITTWQENLRLSSKTHHHPVPLHTLSTKQPRLPTHLLSPSPSLRTHGFQAGRGLANRCWIPLPPNDRQEHTVPRCVHPPHLWSLSFRHICVEPISRQRACHRHPSIAGPRVRNRLHVLRGRRLRLRSQDKIKIF